MKKFLLVLSLLFSWLITTAQVSEEQWVSIGTGTYEDPFWNGGDGAYGGEIEIERSVENPGDYRFFPFGDGTCIRVNAGNSKRVYISSYASYNTQGTTYIVSQRSVESDGSTESYYRTIENNKIEIPGNYFKNTYNGTCSSSRKFLLSFPKDFDPLRYAEWEFIGLGDWQDGNHLINKKPAHFSSATFEKSKTNPYLYRITAENRAYDKVRIQIKHSSRIYMEPFSISYSDVLVDYLQICLENGFGAAESVYGTYENGKITIPGSGFEVTKNGSSKRSTSSNNYILTMPSGFKLPEATESGIYMGLISFNDGVKAKSISLLDEVSKNSFISFVDNMQMDNATYLYYAVELSLHMLDTKVFPNDLTKAILITFTDGLDQGSASADPEYRRTPETYTQYLHDRILSTRINEVPLEAYCIGLMSEDVKAKEFFDYNLTSLSSSPNNKIVIDDVKGLEQTLFDIYDNLNEELTQCQIKILRPQMYDGYKYRFTFDGAGSDINKSKIWFEGVFNINTQSLDDVVYQGFSCTNGTTIKAEKIGNKLQFTLNDCRDASGNIMDTKNLDIDEWYYISSVGVWNHNLEMSQKDEIQTDIIKSSAVVMFAMDASDSLGDLFPLVKSTAASFIRKLAGETDAVIPVLVPAEDFVIDLNDPELEIYNLQGVRVKNPSSGIYICRKGTKAKKVRI